MYIYRLKDRQIDTHRVHPRSATLELFYIYMYRQTDRQTYR